MPPAPLSIVYIYVYGVRFSESVIFRVVRMRWRMVMSVSELSFRLMFSWK